MVGLRNPGGEVLCLESKSAPAGSTTRCLMDTEQCEL